MTTDTVKDMQGRSGANHRPAPLWRVCLLFALFMTLFHLLLWLIVPGDTDPLRSSTTAIVSSLLNGIGISNVMEGTHIILGNSTWIVTPECTAVNVHILFVSFVLAYGSRIRSKLIAIALGLPLLFTANIVRLVVLGWVTENFPTYARFAHDFAWQAVFILLVVVVWLVWIELVVKHEKDPAVPC